MTVMLSTTLSTWSAVVAVLLSCTIKICTSQYQIELDCQPGWEINGHHCYKLFSNPLPWMSAERVCVSYGGHLATPFDYYKNEDIGKFVNDRGVDTFWIGFQGANRMGAPPNDNRVLLYSGGLETQMWVGYWSIYQPKFSDGDCVYVTKDKKLNHKWSFGPCEMNAAFLCQRPVCANGSFHCINGNCVSQKGKCDGNDDCGDRSDEVDCPGYCSWYIRTSGPGTIRYPMSGTNYSNNADCSWLIEADFGYNVQLLVTSFSLENKNDELIVMDGGLTESSSVEIARLTGQPTLPRYFYSSDNKMLINFVSDGSVTSTGFSLSYTQVNTGRPSQSMLTATNVWQEQEFPYYNSFLLGNQDLSFLIEAQDPKQTVSIEVLDIDLPGDATVMVRDGKTVSDSVLAVLTGTFKGNGIAFSTGRYLYIALHTVRGSPNRGLKIRYMQGCQASTSQSAGYISSPGFPLSFYPNGVTCKWEVTVPGAKNVTILFNRMDVHMSDRILIMQGNSVIGNYSGSSIQNPLKITGGQFSVIFTSSPTLNSQGFNLTYSQDCPKPMIDLNLSDITGTLSESYGSDFTVSCKQGSQFSQAEHMGKTSVRMICMAYGMWNVNTSPKCERIRCPKAPGLQNGYVERSAGNLAYNGTVTYKCYQGFRLIGSDTITCDANGQWVNLPSCQASMCNMAPSADPNGSLNITFGNGTLYSSVLRYSCNQGYDLIGDPTMFCDSNGIWVGKAGTCKILTCYTSNFPNGVLSSNKVQVGQQVNLTCNSGYRSVTGETRMTCNSNRTFTPTLSCQNINECDNNRTCEHHCVDTEGSYYCTCNLGFEVFGNYCRDIDECVTIRPCSDVCTNTVGSYQCSCPDGYSLFVANGTQGHFIPPTEDGTQAGDVYRLNHTCVRNRCLTPPAFTNTDLLSQKTSYYYEDTVMYKCQLGYILENSVAGTLKCSQNGTWTGLDIKCLRATCVVDPVPTNLLNPGTVSPHNMSINYGEEIIITCNVPGFTPQTFSRRRKCTLIGKNYLLDGSVNDYECGFISCGKPRDEPGSVYMGLSTYYYRNSFTFSCQSAFRLEGSSVSTRNSTVTCQNNGQWDFGNLSCTGIQCMDPGQPYLGKQVSSDYRDKQLVVFTCTQTGYSLSPPYPISCGLLQNGTARFNGSLPRCVDTQAPNITNCPQNEIIVDRQRSAGSVVPELQIQDNGGFKTLSVSPAWPSSQYFIMSVLTPVEFKYTISDYGNNQADCVMRLRRRDDTPPTIICPAPYNYTFRSDNDILSVNLTRGLVTVKDDVTSSDQLRVTFSLTNYIFNPRSNLLGSFPPIRYEIITVTVLDAADNSAICNFGLYFQPDLCSPYYMRTPPNSVKSCIAVGSGYNCTITCNPGYSLYNNILGNSVTRSCSKPGEAFPSVADVKCVNLTSLDGSYKLEYDFLYVGTNISNSCKASYESTISNTLQVLTSNRSVITATFCETGAVSVQGKISLGFLTISEVEKQVRVRYVISFNRRPGAKYYECAVGVKLVMGSPEDYLLNVLEYKPLECEKITLNQNKSLNYLSFEGYYCEDAKRQLVFTHDTQNISYCLVCPEGMYSNNGMCMPCPLRTFAEMPNMDICQLCPNTTSTYSVGAVSRNECAPECVAGSTSSNGLPPCNLCPTNKYWANATTCLDCPKDALTRGSGSKNQDDCRAPCTSGTFNEDDGHGNCRDCPLHHYSNQTAAITCTECASFDQYTNSTGKTSASDCLKLNLTQCMCQHGTCVIRLPHIWSCICNDGWTGEYCNKSFDPCASHPCYNGGTCLTNGSNYTCSCLTGSLGQNCEQITQTCTPDYCQNNGMCENLVNGRLCHCLPGFMGDRCQTAQDICASQPCNNTGFCTSLGSVRFSCSCPSGFTGSICEQSIDDCYASPCRNNGTCKDGHLNSSCVCDSAYMGSFCEVRKLLCSSVNCGPGGKCVEDVANNTYICVCDEYTEQSSGGLTCKTKDFCARNPCLNNGSCATSGYSFSCTCPFGYGGSLCQHNINDCLSRPCENGGKCQDLVGTYQCNCSGTGFQGDRCNVPMGGCTSRPCSAAGTMRCEDMASTYYCFCISGYTGKNCETDINKCASDPCLHNATCVNMPNDYMCQCPVGWTGKNCEIENMICTSTTCLNGAVCHNYFNGYFCECKPNTYEKNCNASVNICQVANPCVNGSCQDRNGNTECMCDNGYEGDRCEIQQNFCSANMSICKNNGQCIPHLDSYECKCQQGYSAQDCSLTIDYCSSSQCPPGSTCYSVEGIVYCRCPLDKEGQNCNKDWDQNFDLLFDHEHRTAMAYLPYPIKLNSSSFSISLWLQFGKQDDTGTFLSLMTVKTPNSLQGKHLLLWIDERTVHYNVNGTVVNFTHNINYNDGKWHYLVVNVNRTAGVLHFIVDTINSDPVSIPVSVTFDDNIWPVLGALYDPVTDMPVRDKGFYGKLSRFTIYSRELLHRDEVTIVGNTNVSSLFMNSILRWGSELKYSSGVIRKAPSEADNSCSFGYTDYPTCSQLLPGKNLVKIASGQCPSDILMYSRDRLTQVFWTPPVFTGQDSQMFSYTPGGTFVWGKYPVVIKASNADGNTALCLFNIFVQNDNCTSPAKPPLALELQCSPPVYDKYKQCSLICENNTAPSIPSPRIHTCGPVGNWDPKNKFVPYRITPCGGITMPLHQLVINLHYSVPTSECSAVKATLQRELMKTQVKLNQEWNRVCTQANCSDTIIEVTCLNNRRKRQATTTSRLNLDAVLTLSDILDFVMLRSDVNQMKRTEDLYRDLILALPPSNPFDYSNLVSDAIPTLNSINNLPGCNAPKVLLENQCVDCGPGTFYNDTEKECQFCPVGSYQPLSGQTVCNPCLQGTTTPTTGSFMDTECYLECQAGQYMNIMNNPPECTNCSRGSYQPQRGQFSCLTCPADKTTKYTGTILESDCSNDCPPGQEIGSSNNCTDCRIGYYRGPNDAFCQRCPKDIVTQNTSQVSVSACNVGDNPPGTRRRQGDPTHWESCPIGTYQSEPWQFDCISCGPNYLTERVGSTNVSDCKFACPAGQQKKPDEDICVPCEVGYYFDGSDPLGRCQPCQGHNTTLTTGSTSEQNCSLYRCNAGEQPNALNSGCEPCPKGTYQGFPDKPKCDPCSSGNSTRNLGATKQEECESYCPSGAEKNGSLCQECSIGYYKDNSEDLFGNCTQCKNSSYVTPGVGSISNANCTVLNCQEGYKANTASQSCDPCPRGTYQNKKYQTNCIPCGQNLYTRYANSTRPEDCETFCNPGYEKNGTDCNPCPRGYYKDNTVDVFMACTACDSKYVTPAGPPATNASQCTVRNCQAGSYINGDNCTLCAKGTFQDQPWQTNCTQCGPKRNTEHDGATSKDMCLLSCPAGEENNGFSTTCDPCMIGYYKDIEAATKCTACANFTDNDILITTVNGSTSRSNCTRLVCLAGYYPNNNNCTQCYFGTYQPDRWMDKCITCPTGNTTYIRGAISSSDCEFNCSLGEGLVNGTCRKCEIGFYNDKSDPSHKECFKCPSGKITLQEGAMSATQCSITDCSNLGQYRDQNDNSCKNCPIGMYQDNIRQDSCKSCPIGYTTRYEKTTSVVDCKKDCDSGNYLDDINNSCVPCPAGSYRNKTDGNWDCVRCGANLTTPKTGSDKASDCSVATCSPGFAYDQTKLACSVCPVNTYTEREGQMLPCTPCPNNQITDSFGTVNLSGCHYPCSGDKCDIVTQVCVNVQSSYRCDCRSEYELQNNICIHKCNIPNYCGNKGDCIRSPFECKCRDGYTGALCDIRPDASSMSDQETETIIIAVVTSLAGLLFVILLIVCICVMIKKRSKAKSPRTSEVDEHTSIATRSMKGYDDYPTFAVNPVFSSKPPSVFNGPNGALPSQGVQMYSNPTYSGDEDNDPAVYRA